MLQMTTQAIPPQIAEEYDAPPEPCCELTLASMSDISRSMAAGLAPYRPRARVSAVTACSRRPGFSSSQRGDSMSHSCSSVHRSDAWSHSLVHQDVTMQPERCIDDTSSSVAVDNSCQEESWRGFLGRGFTLTFLGYGLRYQ